MICAGKLLPGQLKGERKTISDDEIKFVRKISERNRKDPSMDISTYVLYKVRKPRKLGAPVPTRPVCSESGGITNPIGK